MGTPQFAIPSLEKIYQSRHKIVAIITQPDRLAGRGYKLKPPAVKEVASNWGIPIYQVESWRERGLFEELSAMEIDVGVVVAFGKILPKELLSLPKAGCINLHPSLLPKYRGAAPIQWAIMNGEEKTGVSICWVTEKLDAGEVIIQKEVIVSPADNCGRLKDKLAEMGAELLCEALKLIEAGGPPHYLQDENIASWTHKLNTGETIIDWQLPGDKIHNLIRALAPEPGAITYLDGKLIKIYESAIDEETTATIPGTIVRAKGELIVSTGRACLKILQIKLEGKKKMGVEEYLRGHRIAEGLRFTRVNKW